jgi:hypothetical protein
VKLRFTGEWPPQSLWERYPNWEYALDEEGELGQDETTLRPSEEQSRVSGNVAFTVGIVVRADGSRLPALLEMISGELSGINVFTSESDSWSVRLLGRPASWKCITNDWLPSEERGPVVSPDDTRVFPLHVESHLPLERSGARLAITIVPEGSA